MDIYKRLEEEFQIKAEMLSYVFDKAFHSIEMTSQKLHKLREITSENWFRRFENELLENHKDIAVLIDILIREYSKKSTEVALLELYFLKYICKLKTSIEDVYNTAKIARIVNPNFSSNDLFKAHIELCLRFSKHNKDNFPVDGYKSWLSKSKILQLENYLDKLEFVHARESEKIFLELDQEAKKNRHSSSFDEEKAIMDAIRQGEGDKFGY